MGKELKKWEISLFYFSIMQVHIVSQPESVQDLF